MFRWTDYALAPKPQSDFERIFGKRREYVVRKATYRGARGSKLYRIQNLTPEEAKHFLLHDPHGRQLQRDFPNIPFDQLADHVCEASRRPMEKHEVSKMDSDLKVIVKSENAMHALCKHLAKSGGAGFTHPQFDEVLGSYAANKFPALRLGNAIAKVLAEETPVARAYETVHSAYHPAYAVAKAAVTAADDEADDEDERDGDDDENALEELERLAEQERRRTNGMTKAQAFTKVFTDPANAKLAQRERRQSLAKMMPR